MNLPIYRVPLDLPGTLWIMPHPPAGDLPGAMAYYAAAGVQEILSLMEAAEAKALGLAQEEAECLAQGLIFRTFEIADFSLPEKAPFEQLITTLAGDLTLGRRIAIHCRAGIGRSGIVAAATLVALGIDPSEALKRVSEARGVSVPDTVAQRDFVLNFSLKAN